MPETIRRALVVGLLTPTFIIFSGTAAAQSPGGPGAAPPASGGSVVLNLVRDPGGGMLALAPVTIGGHRYQFVLDTGASVSLIARKAARALRLAKAGRRVPFRGAGGGGFTQPVAVTNWQLGGVNLAPRKIQSEPLNLGAGISVAGLLGSDVLSSFGVVSIDYVHGTLKLGG